MYRGNGSRSNGGGGGLGKGSGAGHRTHVTGKYKGSKSGQKGTSRELDSKKQERQGRDHPKNVWRCG